LADSLRTVKPHVDEELLRVFGRSEVDLFAVIEDDDLVEDIVRRLRSLVDSDASNRAGEGYTAQGRERELAASSKPMR
jgi:hypothetical protein